MSAAAVCIRCQSWLSQIIQVCNLRAAIQFVRNVLQVRHSLTLQIVLRFEKVSL